MLSITGQRPKSRTLVDTSAPVVISTIALLNSKDSGINNRYLSGKKKGTLVLVMDTTREPLLFVAEGSERTSVWSGLNPDAANPDGDIIPA